MFDLNKQAIPFLKGQLELGRPFFGDNAPLRQITIHLTITDCYAHEEKWDAARAHLNQATAQLINLPADFHDLPGLMLQVGVTGYDARQYAEGAKWLEKGLREKRAGEDGFEPLWYSTVLGACYAQLGQKFKAEELIHRNLEACKNIKDPKSNNLALSLLLIAEAELALGKPREALAHYEQCRELVAAMDDSPGKTDGMLKVRYGIAQATKKLEESSLGKK